VTPRTRAHRTLAGLTGLAVAGALVLSSCTDPGDESEVTLIETTPTGTPLPSGPSVSAAPEETEEPDEPATEEPSTDGPDLDRKRNRAPQVAETIARDLAVPWGLAFLPDGDAVVTERDSGRVLLLKGRNHRVVEVGQAPATEPAGEGGLLGVAVSPSYVDDRLVFLYVTTAEDNRILRATLRNDSLGEPEVVLAGIPRGTIHDGGRMVFGPDGHLYVSTGEAGDPPLAQDPDSLGGKILRITPDGEPAPGNPDPDSPVWTLGHRNVQGLAFVGEQLWASEFGDSAFDELNKIKAGDNYGWPQVEGTGGAERGFTDPRVTWSTDDASPAGLAYAAGRLWMGALRGERLWRVDVTGGGKRAGDPVAFLEGDYGRIRTVVTAPDGSLWITTSNQDGRGTPAGPDDRILRVRP